MEENQPLTDSEQDRALQMLADMHTALELRISAVEHELSEARAAFNLIVQRLHDTTELARERILGIPKQRPNRFN
jgi:hypothetical protein